MFPLVKLIFKKKISRVENQELYSSLIYFKNKRKRVNSNYFYSDLIMSNK
jgi:hypothetical protein